MGKGVKGSEFCFLPPTKGLAMRPFFQPLCLCTDKTVPPLQNTMISTAGKVYANANYEYVFCSSGCCFYSYEAVFNVLSKLLQVWENTDRPQ